jgi:murein DD-endopeptidase MepM/ murein hydrolase activator NlpD
VDGSLALEWEEPPPRPRLAIVQPADARLNDPTASDSVPRMAWPEAPGLAARAALRERERAKVRRARRMALLTVVGALALVVLLVGAFGAGEPRTVDTAAPAPSQRFLPSGPPRPQVIAMHEELRIQLPVNQGRVTAIGYHAAGSTALPLEPVGSQANAGLFGRLLQRLLGGDGSAIRYYLLDGGAGPRTGGLDVGAPAETDVYAPVDGTVVAVSNRIVDGLPYGKQVEIQPSGDPGVVVVLTNVLVDPMLSVGDAVVATRTKIGRLLDLSNVQRAELAQYTQDEGQHVHIEVRAAASLAAP